MEATLYAVVITGTGEVKNHHISKDRFKGWTLRNEHVLVKQSEACLSVICPNDLPAMRLTYVCNDCDG